MTMQQSLRAEHIALFAGTGGFCLFLGALGFQYLAGYPPCEMCHWQRWAHVGAFATGLLAITMARGDNTARGLAWFAILFVLTSGLIGAYQTGMEYHVLPGPASCSGHRYVLGSGAPPPEVQCDVVTWSLFGLSMATYNALFSFLIAGLGALGLAKVPAQPGARPLGQGNAT